MWTQCWMEQDSGWLRTLKRARHIMSFFFTLISYWCDLPSGVQGPRDYRGSPEQWKHMVCEKRSGQGIFKQTDHVQGHGTWWYAPRSAEELTNIIKRPLLILWKQASVLSLEWQEGESGELQPVSFASISEKVAGQIILENILKYMKDKKVVRSSHHGLTKSPYYVGQSMITNLVAFYNKMTTLEVEKRAVDVVCLDLVRLLTVSPLASSLINWWSMD